MPTIKPRIKLTLEQPRYDLLKRLAALQGASMSSLVTDILEEFYPVMERIAVVLEAAQQAQETSKQGLREAVAQAEAQLIPLAKATLSQFDLFMDKVEGSFQGGAGDDVGVAARAAAPASPPSPSKAPRKRSAAGANPRVVTRGSGSSTPLPSQPSTKSRNPSPATVSPDSCTCTITKHERAENPTCPVHTRKGKKS